MLAGELYVAGDPELTAERPIVQLPDWEVVTAVMVRLTTRRPHDMLLTVNTRLLIICNGDSHDPQTTPRWRRRVIAVC